MSAFKDPCLWIIFCKSVENRESVLYFEGSLPKTNSLTITNSKIKHNRFPRRVKCQTYKSRVSRNLRDQSPRYVLSVCFILRRDNKRFLKFKLPKQTIENTYNNLNKMQIKQQNPINFKETISRGDDYLTYFAVSEWFLNWKQLEISIKTTYEIAANKLKEHHSLKRIKKKKNACLQLYIIKIIKCNHLPSSPWLFLE